MHLYCTDKKGRASDNCARFCRLIDRNSLLEYVWNAQLSLRVRNEIRGTCDQFLPGTIFLILLRVQQVMCGAGMGIGRPILNEWKTELVMILFGEREIERALLLPISRNPFRPD